MLPASRSQPPARAAQVTFPDAPLPETGRPISRFLASINKTCLSSVWCFAVGIVVDDAIVVVEKRRAQYT